MNLTNEQQMIQDMARSFAKDHLQPNASRWDKESIFPQETIHEMGKLGLLGMLVPENYGGAGADFLSYILAVEEIAAGDGAVSTIMCVQNSVVCMPLLQYGNEEQKKKYLSSFAAGEMLGAFCLSEPQAGSDAADIKTKATLEGKSYVLSGTKQFVTSGKNADVAVVFAVTQADAGKKGMSAFLVPTDTKGYQVMRLEEKMGQHASDTAQIHLDNVKIPIENMLGELGQGYKIALANLEGGRIGIAAQAVGMAQAAYDAALHYAKERKTFSKPIIEHQSVQFRLADMATEISAARLLVHQAARLRDAAKPCLKEAAMAKLFASEMSERVCSSAIQIHGGYGYLSDFPVERIYRDVRVTQIYEGTSDIQRMVIGRCIIQDE